MNNQKQKWYWNKYFRGSIIIIVVSAAIIFGCLAIYNFSKPQQFIAYEKECHNETNFYQIDKSENINLIINSEHNLSSRNCRDFDSYFSAIIHGKYPQTMVSYYGTWTDGVELITDYIYSLGDSSFKINSCDLNFINHTSYNQSLSFDIYGDGNVNVTKNISLNYYVLSFSIPAFENETKEVCQPNKDMPIKINIVKTKNKEGKVVQVQDLTEDLLNEHCECIKSHYSKCIGDCRLKEGACFQKGNGKCEALTSCTQWECEDAYVELK